jgi:hypothetical protein
MNPLFKIFPNAKIKRFEYYLKKCKGNIEHAVYSYGLVGLWELKKYEKEIKELKEYYSK